MRKKRWIAPVWGMLAAAAFGQTASAQPPASPLDGPFPPAGPPVAPGPGSYAGYPTYTPVAPDAASPAGFPPGMEAWPTISPYDHAVDTTYNDKGIWFREMLNHKRRYKIDAEFLSARFRQPGHATIGHAAAIGQPINEPGIDGSFVTTGGVNPFLIYGVKDSVVLVDRGTYFRNGDGNSGADGGAAQVGPLPRPINFGIVTSIQGVPITDDFVFSEPKVGILQVVNFDGTDDTYSDNDGAIADGDEVADTMLYPVTGQVLGEDAVTIFGGQPGVVGEKKESPASPGMRLTFGLEDEDESGVDWSAYWINGEDNVYRRGMDDPNRPRATNVVFFDAPQLEPGAVEVLDYNVLFELRHETETAGTDLAFYHTPMVDYGWLRLRPLYGVRYNYVRETFGFTGRDNGRAYAFDWDGDIFDEDLGVPDGASMSTGVTPLTITDPILVTPINPYETSVTSKVRSHLYGPQIGFDMQTGGEYLMLSAATKTGIVANTEKLSLDAAGFGSSEALTGVRAFTSDAKTHTRVVPFVEFNTNADINVFPIIPVVNRWQFLKNARVRAGYTALIVGNMQRPLDQIMWRSDGAGGPRIKEGGRDAWYTQYWNVGVHWNF